MQLTRLPFRVYSDLGVQNPVFTIDIHWFPSLPSMVTPPPAPHFQIPICRQQPHLPGLHGNHSYLPWPLTSHALTSPHIFVTLCPPPSKKTFFQVARINEYFIHHLIPEKYKENPSFMMDTLFPQTHHKITLEVLFCCFSFKDINLLTYIVLPFIWHVQGIFTRDTVTWQLLPSSHICS